MSHNIDYVKSKAKIYPQKLNNKKRRTEIMMKNNLKQRNIINIMRSYDNVMRFFPDFLQESISVS